MVKVEVMDLNANYAKETKGAKTKTFAKSAHFAPFALKAFGLSEASLMSNRPKKVKLQSFSDWSSMSGRFAGD
jgi:GTP cyclohydrolase II